MAAYKVAFVADIHGVIICYIIGCNGLLIIYTVL